MTDYTAVMERERKRSLAVVTNPDLYEPSKVRTCWLYLKQHGAKPSVYVPVIEGQNEGGAA